MTSPNLRECCQRADLNRIKPEDHFPVCDARAEDPPEEQDALFDVTPPATPPQGPLL